MHSPSNLGLSAVRPETRASRFLPSADAGKSLKLLKNCTPSFSSDSFWNSANSGPPGPLPPVIFYLYILFGGCSKKKIININYCKKFAWISIATKRRTGTYQDPWTTVRRRSIISQKDIFLSTSEQRDTNPSLSSDTHIPQGLLHIVYLQLQRPWLFQGLMIIDFI